MIAQKSSGCLLIFVAGPYSDADPSVRKANVARIRAIVRDLMLRGHYVLECHSLEDALRDDGELTHAHFLRQTLGWLGRCDALYYLGSSPGADIELARAQSLGLPIFHALSEVPTAGDIGAEVADVDNMLLSLEGAE